MKILVNWRESICGACGQQRTAAMDNYGRVICSFCGSEALMGKNWNVFTPKFKTDSRNKLRNWPIVNERRAEHAL